jgi:hypothetical protein
VREEARANCAPERTAQPEERQGRLIVLAFLALAVGVASGFVGVDLRLVLEQGDRLRAPASSRSQQ